MTTTLTPAPAPISLANRQWVGKLKAMRPKGLDVNWFNIDIDDRYVSGSIDRGKQGTCLIHTEPTDSGWKWTVTNHAGFGQTWTGEDESMNRSIRSAISLIASLNP